MSQTYTDLCTCLKQIRMKTQSVPEIGIVLGSGLSDFIKFIVPECIVEYASLKGFPVTTNDRHRGRFVFGKVGDRNIVAMDGRIHYYEGYTMEQVVMPIRLMKMMGAKTLILTNAAGGINPDFKPGNLMVIKDHISSFVPSPLLGTNRKELGVRFPDMSHVYDPNLTNLIQLCGKNLNLNLKTGIYLQTTGPNFETPAEISAFRNLGADAVGMSTACEAIAAVHCGMTVCGISCITNMAAGMTKDAISDEEVGKTAEKTSDSFCRLINEFILSI